MREWGECVTNQECELTMSSSVSFDSLHVVHLAIWRKLLFRLVNKSHLTMCIKGWLVIFSEKNGGIVVCQREKGYICNYCVADMYVKSLSAIILG